MKMSFDKRESLPWIAAVSLFLVVLLIWAVLGRRGVEKIEHYVETSVERNLPFLKANNAKPAALQQGTLADSAGTIQPAVVSICEKASAAGAAGIGTPLQGIGSGVVISPMGYVLTSSKIIKDNQDLKIVNFEQTHMEGSGLEQGHHHVYNASVVNVFAAAGFALLKIDGAGTQRGAEIAYARFGNSDSVAIGDWCLAMGNPFSRQPIAASGMVSSINQTQNIEGKTYSKLIETTCKGGAEFGGGPLVNRWGEIIGIMIDKGYAIPSNRLVMILNGLGINVQ